MTARASGAGSALSCPWDRRDIKPRRAPASRCTAGEARSGSLKGCWRRVEPHRPDAQPDRLVAARFHESHAARLNPGALPSAPMAAGIVRSRSVVILFTALLVPSLAAGAVLAHAPAALAAEPSPAAPSAARLPVGPATPAAAANPITVENQNPGSMGWLLGSPVGGDTANQMKGYWSATSAKAGDTITLFATTNPAQAFTLDIYRMGWYQGTGGRLRLHEVGLTGISQPPCTPDATTGMITCGWTGSYSLTIPNDWLSGMYLGLLTSASGYRNNTIFVVRDDRPAPFVYQQSINTDQAYNNYPNDGTTGKSLYTFNSYGANTVSGERRAVKVSFDRPYFDEGDMFVGTYDMYLVHWLERNGYDVTYSTDVDTHANGSSLQTHKGFLSGGHDEYWSKEMYDAVEAARNIGVNLAFFGSNAIYWQVRYEPSASGAANRVLVCYKDPGLDPA